MCVLGTEPPKASGIKVGVEGVMMTKPQTKERTTPPQQTRLELKGTKGSVTAEVNIQCGFFLKLIYYMIHLGGTSVEVSHFHG